jgi:hypothetical protein
VKLNEIEKEIKRRQSTGDPWQPEELAALNRVCLELLNAKERIDEYQAVIQEWLEARSLSDRDRRG